MHAANASSLSCLRTHSLSCRHYSLGSLSFSLLKYTSIWTFHLHEMHSFKIYGKVVSPSKHTVTHAHVQCSHANVGSLRLAPITFSSATHMVPWDLLCWPIRPGKPDLLFHISQLLNIVCGRAVIVLYLLLANPLYMLWPLKVGMSLFGR